MAEKLRLACSVSQYDIDSNSGIVAVGGRHAVCSCTAVVYESRINGKCDTCILHVLLLVSFFQRKTRVRVGKLSVEGSSRPGHVGHHITSLPAVYRPIPVTVAGIFDRTAAPVLIFDVERIRIEWGP